MVGEILLLDDIIKTLNLVEISDVEWYLTRVAVHLSAIVGNGVVPLNRQQSHSKVIEKCPQLVVDVAPNFTKILSW